MLPPLCSRRSTAHRVVGACRLSRSRVAALPAAALVLLAALTLPGGGAARPAQAVGGCVAGANWGTPRPDLAHRVIALINDYRASRGLPPLAPARRLAAVAMWKARHMAQYGYTSHDDPAPPVARNVEQRFEACGYDGSWGENIASGFESADGVVRAWLGSPGHRANIEYAAFSATGVGAAERSGVVYWTEDFGTAVEQVASPGPAPQIRVGELVASRLVPRARRPSAGRKYTAGIVVTVRSTGAHVVRGHVTCRAHVSGLSPWLGVHRFRKGLATCTWRAPPWASGHRLAGTIGVETRTGATLRWFSRVIR
jgi:uncharacterized protein YkwD